MCRVCVAVHCRALLRRLRACLLYVFVYLYDEQLLCSHVLVFWNNGGTRAAAVRLLAGTLCIVPLLFVLLGACPAGRSVVLGMATKADQAGQGRAGRERGGSRGRQMMWGGMN
jgi:hypothetical protein